MSQLDPTPKTSERDAAVANAAAQKLQASARRMRSLEDRLRENDAMSRLAIGLRTKSS